MKTTSSKVSRISDKAIVNDLAGRVFSASRGRRSFIIAFFYYILKFLLSVGAYIPRALMRKKLGERTFGIITILSIYLLLSSVEIFVRAVPVLKQRANDVLVELNMEEPDKNSLYEFFQFYLISSSTSEGQEQFSIVSSLLITSFFKESILEYSGLSMNLKFLYGLIIIFSIVHFIEIQIRRRREEVVHSFHRGESIVGIALKKLGIDIKERYSWMYLEPIIIFFLAMGLQFFSDTEALVLVLKVSAICLFLEEYRVFIENRSMVLDVIDSQIDGLHLASIQEEYMKRLDDRRDDTFDDGNSIKTVVID